MTARKRHWRNVVLILATVVALGLVFPGAAIIPVDGTSARDWNPKSFWYDPWGASGVHKGIDIFAPKGRSVVAASPGVVIFAGKIERGGTVALVLGPKWRVYYYAHLDVLTTRTGSWLSRGEALGTVGATGNAAGKQPHLHFTVMTLIPYPWLMTRQSQGWKKMFYLDPGKMIG